ncbi:MAG TPA: hypothetical protein VMS99_14890 [Acidimicrobiia bacterium]|nr:hypothetical protein [Acidimicrobiia bacterium]
MSDETVIEAVRREIRTFPVKSGDLANVIRRGRTRRIAYRVGASSGVVALCALLVGLALAVGPSSRPVASDGTLQLTSSFAVPVFDNPVESEGALVYQAESGPEIVGLDSSQLGTEVVVTGGNPDAFVVPVSDNPRNALQADRIVYLGYLEGAQLALHSFNGRLCLYLGNGTQVTGGGSCATEDGLAGGSDSVDPPVGSWLAWSQLPESAAVVVGEAEDGSLYWQRVVGRTVVFILPDGTTVDPATLSALDANGTEVATTRGLQIDPAKLGIRPAIECPPETEEGPLPPGC